MIIKENSLICEDTIIKENNDINNENNMSNNINEIENMPTLESIELLEDENNLEKKETVDTNCLALTVRKDYNISIFKNTISTTFRVTCKVTIFTFILNLLCLFF